MILENEKLKAVVNTHGAELFSLTDRTTGKEFIWQAEKEIWPWHSPLLFPQCGAFPDGYSYQGTRYVLPQHGFLRDLDFTEDHGILSAEDTVGTRAVYPFPFRVEVDCSLEAASFKMLLRVINTGTEDLPFSIGFHTGYNLNQAVLSAGKTTLALTDTYLEEVKKIFESPADVIHIKDSGGTRFLLECPDCTTFVIWSPKGGRDRVVCLEPRIDTDRDVPRHPFALSLLPGEQKTFYQRITVLP